MIFYQQHLAEAKRHLAEKRWGDAAEAFEQVLIQEPHCAEAYEGLGQVAIALGENSRASLFFIRAIECDRQNPRMIVRLADQLFASENWPAAELCYRRALDLYEAELDAIEADASTPANQTLFLSRFVEGGSPLELAARLAAAYLKQEKTAEAIELYREICESGAAPAPLHTNLAYACERHGDLDGALRAASAAVAIDPSLAEAHNMLGVVHRSLHDFEAARRSFERAAELDPNLALARFNMATIDLARGHFERGWVNYEARRALLPQPTRKFDAPPWRGQPLEGQTLLVHTEQGFGDTLQFARFLAMAKERSGARVVLEAPEALKELLQSAAGVDRLVACGAPLPAVDAQIALPSLPGVLGITLETLPRGVPYLAAPPKRLAFWSQHIADLRAERQGAAACCQAELPLSVGIAWRGNPNQSQDVTRSCPLAEFALLAQVPGIDWFVLQKEAPAQEWELLSCNWPGSARPFVLGDELADFADTAAVIHQLDLVITVDTAMAHLAGAMGHAVWTLLAHTPDWRWQMGREDSSWYPTMKLFRQARRNDWKGVIDEVAGALRQLIAAGGFAEQGQAQCGARRPAA
jgi:tetratricopeptide (TPR) repeat protein